MFEFWRIFLSSISLFKFGFKIENTWIKFWLDTVSKYLQAVKLCLLESVCYKWYSSWRMLCCMLHGVGKTTSIGRMKCKYHATPHHTISLDQRLSTCIEWILQYFCTIPHSSTENTCALQANNTFNCIAISELCLNGI